jgi:quinol monooxygenase YgiN
MQKVALFVKLTAQPGRREELVEALGGMFAAVEEEAGTEVYAMHTAVEDPDTVWFYELYTDGDAAAAHGASDTMKAVGAKLGSLLGAAPEIVMTTPVRAAGLSI